MQKASNSIDAASKQLHRKEIPAPDLKLPCSPDTGNQQPPLFLAQNQTKPLQTCGVGIGIPQKRVEFGARWFGVPSILYKKQGCKSESSCHQSNPPKGYLKATKTHTHKIKHKQQNTRTTKTLKRTPSTNIRDAHVLASAGSPLPSPSPTLLWPPQAWQKLYLAPKRTVWVPLSFWGSCMWCL